MLRDKNCFGLGWVRMISLYILLYRGLILTRANLVNLDGLHYPLNYLDMGSKEGELGEKLCGGTGCGYSQGD